MPKVGFAKEDMYVPSQRGFVETIGSKRLGEITAACSRFTQWQASKKTGKQTEPLTSVFLSIKPIDAAGTQTGEPVEQELVVEWGPKDGSMIRIRPGLADSREDDDPKDTVDENGNLVLGTEGNCMFSADGAKLNMTNNYGVFAVSCQDKGFKPQILHAGYLPDYVGMRAWFDLRARKYTSNTGEEKSAEEFIVAEIVRFPYEIAAQAPAAGKGRAAAKPKPVPADKPVAAPAVSTADAPFAAANGNGALDARLIEALRIAVGKHAGESHPQEKLAIWGLTEIFASPNKPGKDEMKSLQTMVRNADWFTAHCAEFGVAPIGDDEYAVI